MKLPNFYASGPLDRAGHRRKSPDWLAERLRHPDTRIQLVWRSQHLVIDTAEGPRPIILTPALASDLIERAAEVVLLGLADDVAHFALDVSALETPLAALDLPEASFRDLRAVGPLIGRDEGAMLAYARGLMHWHARHRFCGVCGAPTESIDAGHVRRCTNPDCATSHFPRTDPAVIMLVEDGDKCLLGRQAVWTPGMYSTLAGFVEPGESLEDAVAREVFEETGIRVDSVCYHSSQPWPFPASIMLGFYAKALDRAIRVDETELEEAHWYSRAYLKDHPEMLPRRDSIARRLIEDWLTL
jgi:NAD+ diphosphatase